MEATRESAKDSAIAHTDNKWNSMVWIKVIQQPRSAKWVDQESKLDKIILGLSVRDPICLMRMQFHSRLNSKLWLKSRRPRIKSEQSKIKWSNFALKQRQLPNKGSNKKERKKRNKMNFQKHKSANVSSSQKNTEQNRENLLLAKQARKRYRKKQLISNRNKSHSHMLTRTLML